MSERVYLDTGIFVAFMNRRDRWHQQAVGLFGGIQPIWSSSVFVRAEAYSWFLHKHGEEAARSFRLLFDGLEGLTVYDADEKHHTETVRILDRYRGAKLTYVDASSLALVDRHGIKQVWATDHHLGLSGLRVLPLE